MSITAEALAVYKEWATRTGENKGFSGKDVLKFIEDFEEKQKLLESRLKAAMHVMFTFYASQNTLLAPVLKEIKAAAGEASVNAVHEAQKKDPKLKAAISVFGDAEKLLKEAGML
jgi:hypothetical protein